MDIENYGRIFRLLEKNIPVKLRINIVNKFYDDNLDSFNILAEIPGSDKGGRGGDARRAFRFVGQRRRRYG